MKNNIIIYTGITGGYDIPTDNFKKRNGYEYHMFFDKPTYVKSWECYIHKFQDDIRLTDQKKQRYLKTHPHMLFPENEIVVYIDANTTIDQKLYDYIEENKDYPVTFKKHPERDCIYDEIKECCLRGKEEREMCELVYNKYTYENYPKHNGLFENNIIISHPANPQVKEIFENWWKEIYWFSKRDQFSLNYVLWKYNLSDIVNVAVSDDFHPKIHIRQK